MSNGSKKNELFDDGGDASLSISLASLEALAALLTERAGLKVAPDGYYSLRFALLERLPVVGLKDASKYVERLRGSGGDEELRRLLPLITVGYTEFFRDEHQFSALEKTLLPRGLERARREARPLSILSAGCATGEEPYSLAMALSDLGARPAEVNLQAVDLNAHAIERAKQGRYAARRLELLSPSRKARHFKLDGDTYEASAELKRFIRFGVGNLSTIHVDRPAVSSFDLVLCRNVIIYFGLPVIQRLMSYFHDVLVPGGHLLLGYSESLYSVYDRFEMIEVGSSFLYRRPAAPARVPSSGASDFRTPSAPVPTVPAVVHPPPPVELDRIAHELERGDFAAGVSELRALAKANPGELAVWLSLGNVLSLMGEHGQAREIFARVAEREPLCVEMHVYGALDDLQEGNPRMAAERLARALFLEPLCAIGHYLLGQALERMQDESGARRAYRNSIESARKPQRPLAGICPELPNSGPLIERAAHYALDALDAGARG